MLSPERILANHVLGKVEVSKKHFFPKHSFFFFVVFLAYDEFLVIAIKDFKTKITNQCIIKCIFKLKSVRKYYLRIKKYDNISYCHKKNNYFESDLF